MLKKREFSISLPDHLADLVESKVASGAYASVSEVVSDGMQALMERDEGIERWLREEVVQSCLEFEADPSQAIPAEDILDRIKARHRTAG